MENPAGTVIRELYRLFLVYEALEQRAAAGSLDAAGMGELSEALGRVSGGWWARAFGRVLETPAHRRFVLAWCLRNAELLMKEQVLPVIAHHVLASHLEERMAALGPETAYDFATQGPADAAGSALRKIHLIQTLTVQIEELAEEGQLPAKLFAQLRRLMIRRVKALFRKELPGEVEAEGPQQNAQTLDAAVRAGTLSAPEAERFRKALGLGPRVDASSPAIAPLPGPNVLELAAAAELIRRLRRLPSLQTAERERLIRMVEGEIDALLDADTAKALTRPLAAIAARLGMPVPPPASATASAPKLPKAAGAPAKDARKTDPDASDFQWAFDLIDELRREGVEK